MRHGQDEDIKKLMIQVENTVKELNRVYNKLPEEFHYANIIRFLEKMAVLECIVYESPLKEIPDIIQNRQYDTTETTAVYEVDVGKYIRIYFDIKERKYKYDRWEDSTGKIVSDAWNIGDIGEIKT